MENRLHPNTKMSITKKQFLLMKVAVSMIAGLAVLLLTFSNFVISGIRYRSMQPTLKTGNVCIVQRTQQVENGDIVIFRPDKTAETQYIKRVIASAGDTVAIHDDKVFVNDKELDEPYLMPGGTPGEIEKTVIPEGYFFAMGDNRRVSQDSRLLGPFPCEQLVGKVIFKF